MRSNMVRSRHYGDSVSAGAQPREVPTVGAFRGVGGTLAFKRDQLGFLRGGIRQHRDIFRFRPLGIPMILVNHPDYIKHILVDKAEQYDKDAALYRIVRPVLRKGLIANADMELWRRQRRMMAPHFTPRATAAFTGNMIDETEQMLQRWKRRFVAGVDTDLVDVTDEIGQLALRIVNRSLFSSDVSTSAQAFERAFAEANNILAGFFRFPFPPLGVPIPRYRRLHQAIADMDAFVSGFIKQRLEQQLSTADATDLLTLLMTSMDEEDGKGMDPEQLHHEVLNICIGAYETTTNTLSWAFYLLARHPDVEAKLHAEVDDVLAGRTPTFQDLPNLAYTRMIAEETLRIYSPAYQFMRRARTGDDIDGYRIPAGSNILINSYFLHRHPEFWDDPESFVPERFSPQEVARRPKHAFIPFGGGHRICIGKHFALTELVLVMATVARTHRLVLPDGAAEVHPEALITLHPKGGVHLRLEERR